MAGPSPARSRVVVLITLSFSRWGPAPCPCRHGGSSWWSWSLSRYPLGSMPPPWPARTCVMVLMAARLLRWDRCPSRNRRGSWSWCAWVLRSSVGVDGAAAAGAHVREGAHRFHPPLGSMRAPLPARIVVWMFISGSRVKCGFSRPGPSRARGRRVPPSGCSSTPYPLGSMVAPRPARSVVVVCMCASPVVVDARAHPRADRGLVAHHSSPVDLSRWGRSSIPGRRGWWCSCALWPRAVSRCRPSAGRRRRGCGCGCSSSVPCEGQPLGSIIQPSPACTALRVLISVSCSAVGVHCAAAPGAEAGGGAHGRLTRWGPGRRCGRPGPSWSSASSCLLVKSVGLRDPSWSRCLRGPSWRYSSSPPFQPLGSMDEPWPARICGRVLIVCSFSRRGRWTSRGPRGSACACSSSGSFIRPGQSRSRRWRGRAWWWSSSCSFSRSGRSRSPRRPGPLCWCSWSRSLSRWGRWTNPRRPGRSWWCSSAFSSAVRVDSPAGAGANMRMGAHLQPSGSMHEPVPALSGVVVCMVSFLLMVLVQPASDGVRQPPLGSMPAPTPARRLVWVVMGSSSAHGVDAGAVARADLCGGVHGFFRGVNRCVKGRGSAAFLMS